MMCDRGDVALRFEPGVSKMLSTVKLKYTFQIVANIVYEKSWTFVRFLKSPHQVIFGQKCGQSFSLG